MEEEFNKNNFAYEKGKQKDFFDNNLFYAKENNSNHEDYNNVNIKMQGTCDIKDKVESKDKTSLQVEMNPIKNRKNNEEKIFFFKFLNFNTKIEMNYDQFAMTIYWTGILELLLFLLSMLFFIIGYFLAGFLIVHLSRSIIGLCIVRNMPLTHHVIENLNGFENESLEDINKKLNDEFKKLLHITEENLKTSLVLYFINSIICFVIDAVGIILLVSKKSYLDNPQVFFFCLCTLGALLSKIIFLLYHFFFSFKYKLFWLDFWLKL